MTSRLGASRSGPSPAPLRWKRSDIRWAALGKRTGTAQLTPSPSCSEPPPLAKGLGSLCSQLCAEPHGEDGAVCWAVARSACHRGGQLPGSGFPPQPWLSPTKPVSVLAFPQKQGWRDGALQSSLFSNPPCVLNLPGDKQGSVTMYADCRDWMTAHQGKCLGPSEGPRVQTCAGLGAEPAT